VASDLTTVLTGVVGAGGVLVGIWLGGKNERQRVQIGSQHERERWHRDQLLNAYAQLVESADNFRKAATDLHNAEDIPDLGRALDLEGGQETYRALGGGGKPTATRNTSIWCRLRDGRGAENLGRQR